MQLVRAPLATRLTGWWMVLIGVSGVTWYLIDVATGNERPDLAMLIFLSVFLVLAVWLGVRTARMDMVIEDDHLIINNQFRSHRLRLQSVTGLTTWRRAALWALGIEVIGVVTVAGKGVPIEATRALLSPFGRWFSQPQHATRQQMTRVAEAIGVEFNEPNRSRK